MSNDTPTNGRKPDGTFAPGNPGGPGRPRRATETAYFRTLADTVTLEDWRAIVARAIDDAKAGDGKAREWLSRYTLGAEPTTLQALAAMEELGLTDDHMTRAEAKYQTGGPLKNITHETPIERAHSLKALDDLKEKAEQELAARARRRAEKQAAKQAAEVAVSASE
jgi:hypothetical protein